MNPALRLLAVALAGLPPGPASLAAAAPAAELRRENLNVGFNPDAVLNMNRNDVEAAFKVFTETAGRMRGYAITPRIRIFHERPGFEAAIQGGALHLAIIDTWTFLTMDLAARMQPQFIAAFRDGDGKRYVVLTRRDGGPTRLADLRGKTIAEFAVANATIGRRWLDTELLAERRGRPEPFFGARELAGTPAAAVLPVFFRKVDACLVDEAGFEVMNELNPQVGRQLQTIARSPALVSAVICVATSGWTSEEYRQDLIRALGELHLDTAGQQILTLFKVHQLVPFREEQIQTVKALREAFDRGPPAPAP
jgi:phosphonate transport system substrate-binding protein